MGHGWHTVGKEELSRRPCSCGKGFIIVWEIEEESDWHAHNRFDKYTEYACPDKCYSKK
ncbi:hypothetical protein NSS79_02485 [Paenibacillus sp. FSL L8-0436]|uniref:hypothetical protein n=1 Tax=Paenibacillus sp. FSL L8-0436 TaxID=2954686 RepID=UPI003158C084